MSASTTRREAAPQSAAAPSPFPPIADYAFLSNCHTGALVAPDGGDRLAVRAALRLAERVRDAARPRGRATSASAPFGINVPAGAALRAGDEHPRHDVEHAERLGRRARRADDGPAPRARTTITPHTRPPADDDADHMLVRTVALHRRAASRSSSSASRSFDYGRDAGRVDAGRRRPPRRRRDRRRARRSGCSTDMALGIEGDRVRARHVLAAGRAASTARSRGPRGWPRRGDVDEANARLARHDALLARAGWRARGIPDHRWREPIQRSALAIKGLTYMPTGATVAALTTSLPETPGGERNWDYRYTWMRDSTFTLQALHYLNLDWEADEFMQFVADLEPNEDGALQIMYGIDGRRDLTESTRDDLSGYAGARPVRIGNGAFDQRQNDVFGAVLDSILLHTRRSQRLPRRLWPIVAGAGRVRDRASGASPTRASGRRAASRSTTSPRSSCAGWRWTARPSSPRSAATRSSSATWRGDRRRDQAPTSSSTASTSAACCASTTTPTRSTPRRCWPRSSASCPATTSGCARACWRSPTS